MMNEELETVEIPEGVKEAFFGWYPVVQKRGIAEVAAVIATRPVIAKAELIALFLLGASTVAASNPERAWNEAITLVDLDGSDQYYQRHPELAGE